MAGNEHPQGENQSGKQVAIGILGFVVGLTLLLLLIKKLMGM